MYQVDVKFFYHIISPNSNIKLLPLQGFRPEGEILRRHSSNFRVYKGKYLQLKYTVIQSI